MVKFPNCGGTVPQTYPGEECRVWDSAWISKYLVPRSGIEPPTREQSDRGQVLKLESTGQ